MSYASDAWDIALVLSGGGARAAYQVGVLQAIAEIDPELRVAILTGVSAGAINTLYLAQHPGSFRVAVENLRGEWLRLTSDQVYAVRPGGVTRSMLGWLANQVLRRHASSSIHGLMDMQPLRKFLAGCMDLSRIESNLAEGRLRAVALSTTCYNDGHTVTFVQGAKGVDMWRRHMRLAIRDDLDYDHLLASAAIPIVFPAVRLGNRYYGDGSVRQSAPLAPAIHLGARKIIAIGMRSPQRPDAVLDEAPGNYPTAAEVVTTLLHSVFLDSLDEDAERLVRVNHLLARAPSVEGQRLFPVDLLMVRPSRDVGGMATGMSPRLPFLVRRILRGMGGETQGSTGLLSYLLFEPEYTGLLMDVGYEDGMAKRDEIRAFLEA